MSIFSWNSVIQFCMITDWQLICAEKELFWTFVTKCLTTHLLVKSISRYCCLAPPPRCQAVMCPSWLLLPLQLWTWVIVLFPNVLSLDNIFFAKFNWCLVPLVTALSLMSFMTAWFTQKAGKNGSKVMKTSKLHKTAKLTPSARQRVDLVRQSTGIRNVVMFVVEISKWKTTTSSNQTPIFFSFTTVQFTISHSINFTFNRSSKLT